MWLTLMISEYEIEWWIFNDVFEVFEKKDFNIKKINKINTLSSVIDNMTRFKHDYWANLVKLCVKHTKSCLIKFMTSFNDLAHLVSYLTQIRKNCNILIIMNLSTLEKKINVQQIWKYHIQKIIYVTTNIFLSLKCFSMHHIHEYFLFTEEIADCLMKYQILKIQTVCTW